MPRGSECLINTPVILPHPSLGITDPCSYTLRLAIRKTSVCLSCFLPSCLSSARWETPREGALALAPSLQHFRFICVLLVSGKSANLMLMSVWAQPKHKMRLFQGEKIENKAPSKMGRAWNPPWISSVAFSVFLTGPLSSNWRNQDKMAFWWISCKTKSIRFVWTKTMKNLADQNGHSSPLNFSYN